MNGQTKAASGARSRRADQEISHRHGREFVAKTRSGMDSRFAALPASKIARLHIRLGGREWAAFHVCGCSGFAAAALLGSLLARQQHLSYSVILVLAAVASATFFAVVLLTKLITGKETITYYHHEIAVIFCAAATLKALQCPIAEYLDTTILGVGVFLAFGRIGCLMVGCCHGRPYRWGARYGSDHVAAGFTPYLAGVRLFPIQAVESMWLLVVVGRGIVLALAPYQAGAAFSWYIVAYGCGRFFLEFLRGDPDRPYWAGLSQPQWVSLFSVAFVVWLENSARSPIRPWHAIAMLALTALAFAVILQRLFSQRRRVGSGSPFRGISRPLGEGRPLETTTRVELERRFGHDFGTVRVHSDSGAAHFYETTVASRKEISGQ